MQAPNHLTCMRSACTGGGRARPGDAAQPAAGRRGRACSAAAACCAQRRLGPHAAARATARQVMSISGAHSATKRDPHLDWKERVASQSWCISKGRAETAARKGWARGHMHLPPCDHPRAPAQRHWQSRAWWARAQSRLRSSSCPFQREWNCVYAHSRGAACEVRAGGEWCVGKRMLTPYEACACSVGYFQCEHVGEVR